MRNCSELFMVSDFLTRDLIIEIFASSKISRLVNAYTQSGLYVSPGERHKFLNLKWKGWLLKIFIRNSSFPVTSPERSDS